MGDYMYFPYIRGRQYELLALRELVENELMSNHVIPVVEPVKLSPTLVNMMEKFIEAAHPVSIIRNPAVGSFTADWESANGNIRAAGYKKRFTELYKSEKIIKAFIMQTDSDYILNNWEKEGANKSDLIVICRDRGSMDSYDRFYGSTLPRYTLIPDERFFKHKVRHNKVLLDDKFVKQDRNADYEEVFEEFFSDDHLYYMEDNFVGFSDYSIVGDDYFEAGFAPYAVAIHIVYFDSDQNLRIIHFVSESNDDISNPALKYYEAVSKLHQWYNENSQSIDLTLGLQTFLNHYDNKTYPGLGTVKKLSLMHHIELIGNYLNGVK